jgi:hypothetical protein
MRDCKFIFNVCGCDEACDVKPGEKIGIQMYILTEGVYWAEDTDKIYFDMYETTSAACVKNNLTRTPEITLMRTAPYYENIDGVRVSGTDPAEYAAGDTGDAVRYFNLRNADGQVGFYRSVNETDYNEKGKFTTTLGPRGTPLTGDYDKEIPEANKVRVLESPEVGDYMITKDDAKGECKLWIDIPAMRIDPAQQLEGTLIQVQVRLLFNREIEGICPECDPPDVCDCVVDVGIMCCGEEGVAQDQGCIFFPYVVQNYPGWQSGIGVSALGREELPEDAWCELTIQDQEGNTVAYKKEDMGTKLVWSFILDNIMDQFDTQPAGGVVSLKIESNYRMDGFSFMLGEMGDSYFGAGGLARGCGAKCCP